MPKLDIRLPYPKRLKKSKDEKSLNKFLKMFKKLQIKILFTEAMEQIPTYIKIHKEHYL